MTPEIQQWNAKVVPRNTRRQRSSGDRKPGGAKPFKHASALYMQALDLKAKHANNLTLLQMLINGLPAYVSHGHGRKVPVMTRTNWNKSWSKYQPHQGKSECARRMSQGMTNVQRGYARKPGDELFGGIGAVVTSEMDVGRPVLPHRSGCVVLV